MGFTIFIVLIALVCFALIAIIMVQNPKGGGLSSSFGGSQNLGGYQSTSTFLDKSTWTLGIALIVLILLSAVSFNSGNASMLVDDKVKPAKQEAPAPANQDNNAPADNQNTTEEPTENN